MMLNDSTLPRLGTPPEKLAEDRGGNRRGPIQTFFSVSGFLKTQMEAKNSANLSRIFQQFPWFSCPNEVPVGCQLKTQNNHFSGEKPWKTKT
jgi:hypothetical protein